MSFLIATGRFVLRQLSEMGRMFLFFLSAVFLALRPPAKLNLILYHVKTIGVDSLSVVVLSGFFTGMVMGFQGYYSLRQFNAESWLGSAAALGLVRELGPVLSAFMVTGRTGSAMAAELGTMRGPPGLWVWAAARRRRVTGREMSRLVRWRIRRTARRRRPCRPVASR